MIVMPSWKELLINSFEFLFRVSWLFKPVVMGLQRVRNLSALRHCLKHYVPASIQFDGPVRVVGSGNVRLGDYCRLGREVQFDTEDEGEICVGQRVRMNTGCLVAAYEKISIGDDSQIGEYVSIRDANHGTRSTELVRAQPQQSSPIHIGKDVWIGRGACILKGVTIGDGAVIGANSVVTRDIPEGAICVGVPAKVIRMRD